LNATYSSHSIHYDKDEKDVVDDDLFIKKNAAKEDLLSFRTRKSYEFAKLHYGNTTSVKESPDISLMLGPQIPTRQAKFDVFVLMSPHGGAGTSKH